MFPVPTIWIAITLPVESVIVSWALAASDAVGLNFTEIMQVFPAATEVQVLV
jgi:hypothetical protein